jgi:hypothetical protein
MERIVPFLFLSSKNLWSKGMKVWNLVDGFGYCCGFSFFQG